MSPWLIHQPARAAEISEQGAGQLAFSQVSGDGWAISSTYQASYNGEEAWCICLYNETTGETATYYVNGSGCYIG